MTTLKAMCKKAGFESVNEFVYLSGKDRTRVHRIFKNKPEEFEILFLEVSGHKSTRAMNAVLNGAEDALIDYRK